MNRRKFFGFLAAAPVGVAAAATLKAEAAPQRIVRPIGQGFPTPAFRCYCGSDAYVMEPVYDVVSSPGHTHSLHGLSAGFTAHAQAKCVGCRNNWMGPTPART